MGLSEVSSVQLQLLLSCEFLRTVFGNSSWIRKAWLNVVMFLQKSKEINLNLFLLCHIFHSILMHMSLPIWLRRLLLCRSPQFVLLLSAQGCFIQQGKERQKDTMSAFCPSNIQKVTLYPSDTSLSLSFVCPFLSRLYSKVHWIGKIRGFCVSSKKNQQRFYMKSHTHNLNTLFLLPYGNGVSAFYIKKLSIINYLSQKMKVLTDLE